MNGKTTSNTICNYKVGQHLVYRLQLSPHSTLKELKSNIWSLTSVDDLSKLNIEYEISDTDKVIIKKLASMKDYK